MGAENILGMAYSGILRRVALVRTDVREEFSASIIRVTRIGELGKMLAITDNRRTLQRNLRSMLRLPVRLTLFQVHRFLSS
jgi:hypothetical protein